MKKIIFKNDKVYLKPQTESSFSSIFQCIKMSVKLQHNICINLVNIHSGNNYVFKAITIKLKPISNLIK